MRVPVILWIALLNSTVVYLVVIHLRPPVPAPTDPTLLFILAPAALGVAAASFVVPKIVAKGSLLALRIPVEPAPNFSDHPAGTRLFVDAAQARRTARAALFTPLILRFALAESVSVFGLVAAFNGYPTTAYLGFFLVSWLLFALAYPAESNDDALLEWAYDARLR